MEYYELRTRATLVIGTLAALLWIRTRNVSGNLKSGSFTPREIC
jgi:hypothetical protein